MHACSYFSYFMSLLAHYPILPVNIVNPNKLKTQNPSLNGEALSLQDPRDRPSGPRSPR